MVKFLFTVCAIVLFSSGQLSSREVSIYADIYEASALDIRHYTSITIEDAVQPDDVAWGLMQRETLPEAYGLLLHYRPPQRISLWMFNCLIDLSVAFIDCQKVIREMRDMHAYPQMMCQLPPITNVQELRNIPPSNSVVAFFRKKGITSNVVASYAYETNIRWFQENGVRIGDVIGWDDRSGTAWICYTTDISCLKPSRAPIFVGLHRPSPVSVWLAKDNMGRDVAFLDGEQRILKIGSIQGGSKIQPVQRPVLASDGPATSILIAPMGWFSQNNILVNDEIGFVNK